MYQFKPGDYVVWKWAGPYAQGVVLQVTPGRVEIESKGKRIVRNGSAENPAVTISHESGSQVLKLSSELQRTHKDEQ